MALSYLQGEGPSVLPHKLLSEAGNKRRGIGTGSGYKTTMSIEKPHFARIDGLRGVAILAVFLFHYSLTINQRDPGVARAATLPAGLESLLNIHALGFLGVQLFFVISGFCIHHSYLSWRRRNPTTPTHRFFPEFFHRRFWRIVPPYLVALFTVYFMKTARPFSAGSMLDLLPHVGLLNTLSAKEFFGINPSFWSVAVEWQLYVAYPLVLWLFNRFGGVGGFLTATLISVVFRFITPMLDAPFFIQNLPFKWWYDWSIGALIAVTWAEQRRLFPAGFAFGAGFAVVTFLTVTYSTEMSLRWAAPPLFFAYVVEASVFSQRPVGKVSALFAMLGLCSYSFYLWHQPLTHLAISLYAAHGWHGGPVTIWVWLCAFLLIVFTVWSVIAYRWIELPSIAAGQWLIRRYREYALRIYLQRHPPTPLAMPSLSNQAVKTK